MQAVSEFEPTTRYWQRPVSTAFLGDQIPTVLPRTAQVHATARIDLKDAQRPRVTCDQAIASGLTLDIDMIKRGGRGEAENNPPNAPPLVASDHADDGKYHLLLAASGSVATIKIPEIVKGLATHPDLSIRIVLTESACRFLQGQSDEQPSLKMLASHPHVDAIYLDHDEWKNPWVRGAPILHIELRRWADMLVIAPLSANTLAKISNGLCDNLLTSVVRAWEVQPLLDSNGHSSLEELLPAETAPVQKRIVVAPAMNTAMWRHPLTAVHLARVEQSFHWFDLMRPVEKTLACGDTGTGAMCDWRDIVEVIRRGIEARRALGLPVKTPEDDEDPD